MKHKLIPSYSMHKYYYVSHEYECFFAFMACVAVLDVSCSVYSYIFTIIIFSSKYSPSSQNSFIQIIILVVVICVPKNMVVITRVIGYIREEISETLPFPLCDHGESLHTHIRNQAGKIVFLLLVLIFNPTFYMLGM